MGDPKSIRRDQLARFIPDNETILRFQRLFEVVGGGTSTGSMSSIDAVKEELEFYVMTRSVD